MLESREDYEWVSQDALKRVQIDGMPYPVRPQKLIVKGEDEAYLREAVAERRFLRDLPVSVYTAAILRITQGVLRAAWLYDAVSEVVFSQYNSRIWVDADTAEDFSQELPQGPFLVLTGTPTDTKPQGVDAAIDAYNDRVDAADDALADALADALDALVDALRSLYDARDNAVSDAESARDEAIEDAEASLAEDLDEMEDEHDAALDDIERDYSEGRIDASERDRLVAEETERYRWAVVTRRDEADKAVVEARDAFNEAVRSAEFTLYDSSKAKWAEYEEEAGDARTTHKDEVASARLAVNAAVTNAETGAVYSGYLRSGASPSGDGMLYSDALDYIAAAREEMKISELCLGKYLRKTPLLLAEPAQGSSSVTATFAAHAPSSDATMRAYADLERLRCCSITPPTVYRCPYYQHQVNSSSISYYDETDGDGAYRSLVVDDHENDAGDFSIVFSNTDFAVYFGRRHEVEKISGIYATVALSRGEVAGDGTSAGRTINNTYGYARIKLTFDGIAAESDLAEIDAIRDGLAEDLAHFAEIRDAAYADAEATYLDALADNEEAYESAVADADAALESALLANARACNNALVAAEKAANSRIAAIEEDEEDRKKERIEAVLAEFREVKLAKTRERTAADMAAQTKRNDAVAAAQNAKWDADAAARDARTAARRAADEAYGRATEGLADDAQERIDEIKAKPAQRRIAANEARDVAIADAADERDDKIDAASDAFNAALTTLTVGSEPIMPNHPGWLEFTPVFPNSTLTAAARAEASQAENAAFNAAFNTANAQEAQATAEYNSAVADANRAWWEAKAAIKDIRENERGRWVFSPEPIDSDALSLPSGDYAYHTSQVWMAGVVHFDVVYEPKSLTGADFEDYYAELDEAQ